MATMNISLPDSMKAFIEQRITEDGYSTASEYFRQLVREDQKRKDQERLDALLLEGLESGPAIEITPEYWERKIANLLAKQKSSERSE